MIKLNANEKYLIGVSGGPDSIFLLHEIVKINPKDLVVCHINYHFRSDSDEDQRIVTQFCEEHNLKLEIKTISPSFYKNFKGNFESWAREQRYTFFQEMGVKHQIFNLLIAHTENDLIETYLLQKKRNNLVNYYGLAPITTYQNLQVIRPMLKIQKSQILEILNQEQIPFAWDSTNNDFRYERNKLRQKLKEKDFAKIILTIQKENETLKKEINQVQFYVKNHLTADELILDEQLKKLNLEMIQRVVYHFFSILKKENLLQKRKRQTLVEISKRIKNSPKVFWKIQLNDYFLIQDFNHLYLIEQKNCEFKKIIINNHQELEAIQIFINWLDIFNAIKKNGELYPYIVTNDFHEYKLKTTYQNQRTNRYLIDRKISYKKRFLKAVVYQAEKKIILNKIG